MIFHKCIISAKTFSSKTLVEIIFFYKNDFSLFFLKNLNLLSQNCDLMNNGTKVCSNLLSKCA